MAVIRFGNGKVVFDVDVEQFLDMNFQHPNMSPHEMLYSNFRRSGEVDFISNITHPLDEILKYYRRLYPSLRVHDVAYASNGVLLSKMVATFVNKDEFKDNNHPTFLQWVRELNA